MSQWDRLPSGSKRRSDFTEHERPGSYRLSLAQQSHTSQSPKASTSPHSSQEGRTPKGVGQSQFLTAGSEASFEVGSRIDASQHSSSSTMRLPTPSSTSAVELALPPVASSRPARYANYTGNALRKFGPDLVTTQALQYENNDLSSAYAQAQLYIADLNTKVQACQVENGKLAKERQRLMGKVEVLEAQLEELERSIEQSQKHTAAKDAQYSHIMELSTRLQSQGAEARKAEQHEWSCERKNMQGVIDSLSNEVFGLRKAYASHAQSTRFTDLIPSPILDRSNELAGNPFLAGESSPGKDIKEMESLKRTNARMGDALVGVRGDNAQLAECIEKLGRVEKNIHRRLHEAETAKALLDSLDREGALADMPASK